MVNLIHLLKDSFSLNQPLCWLNIVSAIFVVCLFFPFKCNFFNEVWRRSSPANFCNYYIIEICILTFFIPKLFSLKYLSVIRLDPLRTAIPPGIETQTIKILEIMPACVFRQAQMSDKLPEAFFLGDIETSLSQEV